MVAGEATVRAAVVAPVLHRYVLPPDAVIVVEACEQLTPLVAEAAGSGLTVMTLLAVVLQVPLDTVTL